MFEIDVNQHCIPIIYFSDNKINSYDVSLRQKLELPDTLRFSVFDSDNKPQKGDRILLEYGKSSSSFIVDECDDNTFECISETTHIVKESKNRGLVINI